MIRRLITRLFEPAIRRIARDEINKATMVAAAQMWDGMLAQLASAQPSTGTQPPHLRVVSDE